MNFDKSGDNKIINYDKSNEKEIKEKCIIKINNERILFPYNINNLEGKYIIKYIFKNNLANAKGLFYECKNLISLDLSNFNTQNVTNMSTMFYGCSSLTNLNLSNFKTQNVTNMSCMFDGCSSLTNLNLSNFKTQNVTNMSGMFYECSSLTNLNLSNFNTQNVTNMNGMTARPDQTQTAAYGGYTACCYGNLW